MRSFSSDEEAEKKVAQNDEPVQADTGQYFFDKRDRSSPEVRTGSYQSPVVRIACFVGLGALVPELLSPVSLVEDLVDI